MSEIWQCPPCYSNISIHIDINCQAQCSRPNIIKRVNESSCLESSETWATSVPILVFLGLSGLNLDLMYTTVVRQTYVSITT